MTPRTTGIHRNRTAWFRILLILTVLIGAATLVSAPKSPFTPNTKPYFADAKLVNFVRPGLVITILSAEIGADGTIKARVRFADPKGVPLDKDGIQTPGAISASAIAAYIPKGQTQYVAYTTRPQGPSPITGVTAIQAGADSGGTWVKAADGEYVYTFKTKAPANFDKSATHAIGVYGNRDLSEFDFGTALDDAVFPFVPDGSAKPVTRDVIRTQSCRRCHVDSFAFHGTGGRSSVEMCALCHTPQSVDPDTGNTVDLAVMIHKIHMGKNLPSVVAGGKYQIVGHSQIVADYSDVSIPTDARNCTVCHEQNTGAAQAKAYLKPNRAACGSCHDTVNFNNGLNHTGLPQKDDTQCTLCHLADTGQEFDTSVMGAHMLPYRSKALTGIKWTILSVDNVTPGSKPTVTFTLQDKNGNPLAPSDFARLNGVLAGPSTDYTWKWAGQTTAGYVSEDLTKAAGDSGTYTYTFTAPIPAKAAGTFSISLEGRRVEKIYPGTKKEQSVQYGATNAVYYFSVDDSPAEPRRTVVAIEKCQGCHVSLRMHGENRVDNIQHCVVCHNPVETDVSVRPASAAPVQSIDFRQMIHNIHGGAETQAAYKTEDYVIYGHGGSKNSFSEVTYPGRLASCEACHVNGSQQLPLAETHSVVANPRGYLNPSGPEAAACLSCHRGAEAAAHAATNTSATLGESCGTCHGPSAEYAVQKVHAAPSLPQPK